MAQKRNYQKEMEEIFSQNKGRKLLLHCCCAPCATHCIACVEQEMDTTLYFYNPNIMMREEYEKRLSELQRYVREAQCRIRGVVEGSYDNDFSCVWRRAENWSRRGARGAGCVYPCGWSRLRVMRRKTVMNCSGRH